MARHETIILPVIMKNKSIFWAFITLITISAFTDAFKLNKSGVLYAFFSTLNLSPAKYVFTDRDHYGVYSFINKNGSVHKIEFKKLIKALKNTSSHYELVAFRKAMRRPDRVLGNDTEKILHHVLCKKNLILPELQDVEKIEVFLGNNKPEFHVGCAE